MPSPTAEWERAGWIVVWHDEFDGTELDRNNWAFDIGGGGWGNPKKRDRKRVAEEVRNGVISREAAVRDYGMTEAELS